MKNGKPSEARLGHGEPGTVLAFGFRRFGFWISIWLVFLAATARAQMPIEGDVYAHDPSTMIKEGDHFYLFTTSVGIMGKYSTDLRHWTNAGKVFPDEPPAWTRAAVKGFVSKFWAPDVAFVNGKYLLYYSCSTFGKQVSAIGLVTSPSLSSPRWTDQGAVIQSAVGDPYNCIDPGILVETNGRMWLVFGSFFDGIFLTQLDPATGKRIATNSPVTRVAHNGASAFQNTTEAPYLYQHDGYYYLFLNFGKCCSGTNSTYEIRVGRAINVAGPYLDRDGVNLLNGGGSLLLKTEGRYIGPGHAGILSDTGTNWFTYHYYDRDESGTPKLGLTKLYWTPDHWPALTNDLAKPTR